MALAQRRGRPSHWAVIAPPAGTAYWSAMAESRVIIARLRTALIELLPRSCTVTEGPTTFFCSDEVAVAAQIFLAPASGPR
jgi:hypothetical protein